MVELVSGVIPSITSLPRLAGVVDAGLTLSLWTILARPKSHILRVQSSFNNMLNDTNTSSESCTQTVLSFSKCNYLLPISCSVFTVQ